jgi:hypothetical protein
MLLLGRPVRGGEEFPPVVLVADWTIDFEFLEQSLYQAWAFRSCRKRFKNKLICKVLYLCQD